MSPNSGMGETAGLRNLWELADRRGMGRREFLRLLAAGGAAAVLAACTGTGQPGAGQGTPQTGGATGTVAQSPTWFKDTEPFIQHGSTSLETRLERMEGIMTPNELFFARNNSASLDIDAANWRLRVDGDAAAKQIELSYDDLQGMPSRSVVSYLECGGNQRAMFQLVQGQTASGTQWKTGGISNGEWTGVPLRDVLTMAGIADNAVTVMLIGLDTESPEGGFRRAMPVEKAMHPDTLLAYRLNGAELPKDHGYPVRVLAPGWVGSSSVKWLGHIQVLSEQVWTRNNTTSYVLIGDAYPPEGEALGKVTTSQVIKSALALPWPATLAAGQHRIHGYASSPTGRIAKVEWSADSGQTWMDAEVLEPQVQYSWARFEFTWEAEPGEHTVMTRATDAEGNTQPDEVPFNDKGYLFNQPLPHPVTVS